MTDAEAEYTVEYERAWAEHVGIQASYDMDCFFNLGDNPTNRLSWSAGGRLPGFRKSAGKLWHPASRRFLTDNERLATLGFPVYPPLAEAGRTSLLVVHWHARAALLCCSLLV